MKTIEVAPEREQYELDSLPPGSYTIAVKGLEESTSISDIFLVASEVPE